ncbi:MAG: hypothetical protein GXO83_06090 [Chlorobi bacterium]|nr:hypothetical protein [Chlorobiota bacterium]
MEKIILLLIGVLGLFVLIRRFISIRKGESASDELSRLILQKASSLSFYITLYLWILISYLSDKVNFESGQIIGYGIIGMAVIFSVIWLFLKIIGLHKD